MNRILLDQSKSGQKVAEVTKPLKTRPDYGIAQMKSDEDSPFTFLPVHLAGGGTSHKEGAKGDISI